MSTGTLDLTQKDYILFQRLVYNKSGINLGDQKQQLVRARLGKRVRENGFASFREYYYHIEKDHTGEELCYLLDAISTNTTHLFREMRHFTVLREILIGWVDDAKWRSDNNSLLRVWSAGCSSGEEPHSLAMLIHDVLKSRPGVKVKILATDLSTKMLSKAALGIYETQRVGTVPPEYRKRYLKPITENGQRCLQVIPEIRRLITFSRFNLMSKRFPFRHGFNVIFCRNVMIYFDKETQTTLVGKYAEQLHPGGYLMIGHSESLNSLNHPLSYVEPTVYRKG